MYAPPHSFKTLVNDLIVGGLSAEKAQQIVFVEITLRLAEKMMLESEPITVGWVLLSRMPVHDLRLKYLKAEQRRMWANASVIVPFHSRYAWERALVNYSKLKFDDNQTDPRLYRIASSRLDSQMITTCRQNPCTDDARVKRYDEILQAPLAFERRNHHFVKAGRTYKVRVKSQANTWHVGHVTISDEMVQDFAKSPDWFDRPRPHTSLKLHIDDLLPTAQFLDEYERRTGGRTHWVRDLKQIRFCKVIHMPNEVIVLGDDNVDPLVLNGTVHVPGMVSAGKTTLAKLIIAHCIGLGLDIRIILVVGDTNSAVEIAHQINTWFCDDPAGDTVMAVPILGASQREVHLERLLISRHYLQSLEKNQPHWGERWLMPVCPLSASISWDGAAHVAIRAGDEPCQGLIGETGREHSKRHLCPLFHHCPSKQLYRDMPKAQIWITTPGALAQSSLPLHDDQRIIKLGDLVYEQADLLILDEVETIVDWYDRTFAAREELTNGKDGLLDRLDRQISTYWSGNRVLRGSERRWLVTVRESLKALSSILTALDDPTLQRVARDWVERGYFTPHQLAYRLARRFAGLKEWDASDVSLEEKQKHSQMADEAFEPFDELLNRIHDPLRRSTSDNFQPGEAADGLARLMQDMNNLADDVTDDDLLDGCRDWILKTYPNVETRLEILGDQLKIGNEFDQNYARKNLDRSVNEMAGRLKFMLTATLLDRHLHIVLQEWHNKPESLDAAPPFGKTPPGAQRILPLPLTGQMYGFVFDANRAKHDQDAPNRLSLFSYTNIGRKYLLDFNRLREDFDGSTGPHILALSGTSYLPDSTAFHVDMPVTGILKSPHQTEQAIEKSRFIWRYFMDDQKQPQPINVSGQSDKTAQLRRLMKAMLSDGGMPGGFLGAELEWLKAQAKQNPADWEDRDRLLLFTNSYTQAHQVAVALRDGWRSAADTIYELKQGKGENREDYQLEDQTLRRIDIEQFADTGGRILIAPMLSIGRGFNILNNADERKAAFGSVFFLTRPMTPPKDMVLMAQELNRFALEWADDPEFCAWANDTLYKRAVVAREQALKLRSSIEQRLSYADLKDDAELRVYPRRDLAATTAGRIIQAVGRLLRGGAPFRAYFVDAAWSPDLARTGDRHRVEPEDTSLLTAMINVLAGYTISQDVVGQALYDGLYAALSTTMNRDNN